MLSEFFAEQGVTSLRYDKRGCGKSTGDYYQAGFSDFIEDAKTTLEYLKSHESVDKERIIVLGHSEGAFLAPAVNDVFPCAGLILLCGGIDSGKDLLPIQPQKIADEIRQLNGFKGKLLRFLRVDKFIIWQFTRVQKQSLTSKKSVIRVFGLFKFNAKWLREFYHFNVKKYLSSIICPTLVVGAGQDIQIAPENAERIAEAITQANSVIIPNMNHLLRNCSGAHSLLESGKHYRKSVKEPLSSELLRELTNWLREFYVK